MDHPLRADAAAAADPRPVDHLDEVRPLPPLPRDDRTGYLVDG